MRIQLHVVWITLLLASSVRAVETVVPSGAMLARQYCSACHLFPEPDLLDKKTWANHAFRKMAPFLGVGKLRTEGRPDGRRIEESNVFPPTPLLSEADWNAIRNYYIENAPAEALPQPEHAQIVTGLPLFAPEKLTLPGTIPSTTMVRIDRAIGGIVLGDAASGGLAIFGGDRGPARRVPLGGAPVDLAHDGNRLLATLIGHVFPSDVPDGKVVVVPAAGSTGSPVEILSRLERPTQCVVADLNGDGRSDLLVCSFGNLLGRLSWFERAADGTYIRHDLLEVPGAVHAEVRDLDGDGKPEIVVLMAQGKEGLFLFANKGGGKFEVRPLLQFGPANGTTYFEFADMNRDGFPDVVIANGDNGEYPSPFKRYHGVRIYLNDGKSNFTEAYFYPINGAFKVVARDFDGDGDLDLAAISFFPDYRRVPGESFVYLENLGGMRFAPRTFAGAEDGRWITMDAGDVDGDGHIDIVLGAFAQGPPGIDIPQALSTAWRTNGVNALLLRNTRGKAGP